MKQAPVSVIIPCYRCGGTIARAVDSVARQTLVPAEVILVDDCSNDGTVGRLHELQDSSGPHWIRVLESAHNGGPSAARNMGWEAASQPYIAFLDADDSWHPQKTEIQHGWMAAHPDIVLSGTWESLKRDTAPPPCVDPASVVATSFSRTALLLSNPFFTSSVMLKRDIRNRFERAKSHSEDFLLWLQICLSQKGVRLSAALAYRHQVAIAGAGLSSDLASMSKGELDTYSRLFRQGYINVMEFALLQAWSRMKHARRLALQQYFLAASR